MLCSSSWCIAAVPDGTGRLRRFVCALGSAARCAASCTVCCALKRAITLRAGCAATTPSVRSRSFASSPPLQHLYAGCCGGIRYRQFWRNRLPDRCDSRGNFGPQIFPIAVQSAVLRASVKRWFLFGRAPDSLRRFCRTTLFAWPSKARQCAIRTRLSAEYWKVHDLRGVPEKQPLHELYKRAPMRPRRVGGSGGVCPTSA
jgi:hypothetical protein